MSYDFLCYPSRSGTPRSGEAETFYNTDYRTQLGKHLPPDLKQKIATALMQHNPRLQPVEFDYSQIAQARKISEEEARRRYRHIELNAPSGDPAIQITVCDDHVDITIPFWYEGDKAAEVFAELLGYLRVIRESAGFFAYDRQTGVAFDPLDLEELNREIYDGAIRKVKDLAAKQPHRQWWKFW